MEQKLIIMQGPPACGKSTVAIAEHEKDPENIVIVSRDAFRHGRGRYWIPKQEKYIEALETYAIYEALRRGLSVIVDATNLNPTIITNLTSIAASFNVPAEGWLVHTEKMDCLARNINEDRKHRVDQVVIYNFYNKYKAYCEANNIEMVPGTITKRPLYTPL